jgi:hypothetical protein
MKPYNEVVSISSIDSDQLRPVHKNDDRCAPGLTFDAGSCVKLKLLISLVNAHNKDNKDMPENQIVTYPNYEMINPRKYKKYLVKEMNNLTHGKSHKNWAEYSFVEKMDELEKEELKKHTFRPSGPKGKFEWLNTLHIDDVMKQYEGKYTDFKFLGTIPMDFDSLPRLGIKNLNYANLIKEGKTKLGVVFNLDDHDESGSHWVAMYTNLKEGEIFYFDSFGVEPEPRVQTLMQRIEKFCQVGMGIKKLRLDYNKVQHQQQNSECGVYSINFLVRMLKGEGFDNICESAVRDKKINKCRNIYFSNTNV